MEDGTVWMVPGGYENYGKRSPEQKCSGFFMHTGTQRKDVSRADGCPARAEEYTAGLNFVTRRIFPKIFYFQEEKK